MSASSENTKNTHPRIGTVSYATPAPGPTQNSGYATASLAVAGFFLAWQWVSIAMRQSLVFDISKEDRIIALGGVLSLILAFASYRQPFRRRTLSHVAIAVSAAAFLSTFLLYRWMA